MFFPSISTLDFLERHLYGRAAFKYSYSIIFKLFTMDINVSFDEQGRVRVLDADKYEQTKQLQEQCSGFSAKLDEFNSTIATLVEVMDEQATKIEKAKLKAIGQRNKVDSEEGNRKRRAEELRAQINEDLTDLERLRAEHDSLNAVELEQRGLIERLSNNA